MLRVDSVSLTVAEDQTQPIRIVLGDRFVQARVGVKMSPDSKRAICSASCARRSTLPGVDVGGPLSLDARRRNLSEPQLHAVTSARRRCVVQSSAPRSGQLHASLQRKLTAPSDVSRPHPSPTSGKERKGKEEYLYSAFSHQGTSKALRHGSHSFTCKQHHACLSFVAFTRCHHHSN